MLHDRSGFNDQNIQKTYTEELIPALSQLYGQDVHGVWTLEVVDHAALDVGTLRHWRLEAEILQDDGIHVESTPAMMIPDDDPEGIHDIIHVSAARTVTNIEVEVDISHSWRGDLQVELTSPTGTTVSLHHRSGGPDDDIRRVYRSTEVPALAALIGESATGAWDLHVRDQQTVDIGKLNRWALTIR